MSLSKKTREEVKNFLYDNLVDTMFSGKLEDDYIRNGMSFKGLNNFTDQELIDELLIHTGEDEELVVRAKQELEVESLLKT